MWMWKEIDIEYLGRFGYTCPPDLQKIIEGMSFSETAEYFKSRFRIPDSIDEIKAAWIQMSIEKYRNEVTLKPGALRLLQYLETLEKRRACHQQWPRHGRRRAGILTDPSVFSGHRNACEVAAGKPAPDIYLEVARRLQAEPSRCMVFEDVPAGIQAGKRAGMRSVPWKMRSPRACARKRWNLPIFILTIITNFLCRNRRTEVM